MSVPHVYFASNSMDARTALSMIRDGSDLLGILLDGGHSVVAGAFRNIGNQRLADEIIATMQTVGYGVRENDPFEEKLPLVFSFREISPCVNPIGLMWHQMRQAVIEGFPEPPGLVQNADDYLKEVLSSRNLSVR